MHATETTFFATGGTLRHNAPSYVERRADRDLFDGLVRGEFCYVLTSRQMGKSSLMVRTANRLRVAGMNVIVLDLTAIGQNLKPEQWYDGLIVRMGQQLHLEDELDDFWQHHERIGPLQRWRTSLQDVILPALKSKAELMAQTGMSAGPYSIEGRLTIFVDEIDTVRSLPFSTDEFFAAIRECYNRRTQDSELNRLTFCLLGVATPSDLISDTRLTPFNVGQRIELTDFTREEAALLAEGFCARQKLETNSAVHPASTPAAPSVPPVFSPQSPEPIKPTLPTTQGLLDRVFYWTNGHPYLTQRFCRALATAFEGASSDPAAETTTHTPAAIAAPLSPKLVDQLCEDLFLSTRSRERDDNLLFVRERILRSETNLAKLLSLYDAIRNGQTIPDDESNPLIEELRISGITRVERGLLVVRNRIYERVFNRDWIMANKPVGSETDCKTIAVLPFVDLTAEDANEHWTDGLAEELINALGQVPGLRVASRASAFKFKGKSEDVRRIGAQLNAEVILEGRLRRLEDRLRISVELVNVADGYRLWAETYNYGVKDLFEIQDEIARAIVARLRSGLGGPAGLGAIHRKARNLEAYNLYLRGRYFWNRRTEEAVNRSIGMFEEAIKKDPLYAMAYAGIADAYNILGTYNYVAPKQAYPKAQLAAGKALELDENLAQAHVAMACACSIHDWDWRRAEEEFQRAIALNPSYAIAHQWYAINCLTPLGRHDEALNELRLAQEVDPLSISISASVGLAYYFARQFDAAIEQCSETIELDRNFWITHLFLGWACLEKGRFQDGINAFETATRLNPRDSVAIAALGHAYGLAGNERGAKHALEQLVLLSKQRYVPASEFAGVHLGLGDIDSALQWFDKACAERSFRLIYIKVDPKLESLRSEPRFGELLNKVGLHAVQKS